MTSSCPLEASLTEVMHLMPDDCRAETLSGFAR